MDGLLSQEEIDKLRKHIFEEPLTPSIIEIKPDEISNIEDVVERNKMQANFEYINKIYIDPLKKLLLACHKINKSPIPDVNNLSLVKRINTYGKALITLGFTPAQLDELVPKDEEEFDLIVSAMEKGFEEQKTGNNKNRLIEVRNYLRSLEKEENHTIESSRKTI